MARLFASWWQGPAIVEGGFSALYALLVEKLRTLGAEVRERERTVRILTTRGAVTSVLLSGSDEPVGAGFVVSGHDLSRSLRLFEDRRAFERTFETKGEPQVRHYRFTLNLVLPEASIPVGLARDTLWVRNPEGRLWGDNAVRIHRSDQEGDTRGVLTIESLLPRRGVEEVTGYLDAARERLLDSLEALMPFLRDDLVLVDSPHDGRPPTDAHGHEIEGAETWGRGPRSMRAVHGYPVAGTLGVGALPIQTPVKRFLLANDQVLPGLGVEGELLAAAAAARIVTKSDKQKDKMRRGLWTKAEI
jgi:phytoene dehydrogenase-like protein